MYTHAVAFGEVGTLDLMHEVVLIEYKPKGRRFWYHTMNGYKKNIVTLHDLSMVMQAAEYVRSESYLINSRCIRKIEGNRAFMTNGMDVHLTRQARRELRRLQKKHNYIF
ncbi:hypothetical protein M3661_16845 [Paenibacillus sp. MER 180]|uniref:hypothetical protein n=1 Tax=Paenibacillus sp. MER 180 TaxID=2939570 RepID=UPI00203E4A63|nr:hypothetical protein [Paenibacillus sp. MER 180]MCM3291800.1 hypothetical protein [Paenibacillus sp. MER 180]